MGARDFKKAKAQAFSFTTILFGLSILQPTIYLYGGSGYDRQGTNGILGDLWKARP